MNRDILEEKIAMIEETIEKKRALGFETFRINLVVSRAAPPRGENVRLAGRYGPRSLHIHCVQGPVDGWYSVVASFDAEKVLTWLRKQRNEQ